MNDANTMYLGVTSIDYDIINRSESSVGTWESESCTDLAAESVDTQNERTRTGTHAAAVKAEVDGGI